MFGLVYGSVLLSFPCLLKLLVSFLHHALYCTSIAMSIISEPSQKPSECTDYQPDPTTDREPEYASMREPEPDRRTEPAITPES